MATMLSVSDGIPELLPMVRSGDPSHHISAIVRYMCLKLGHFATDETRGGPDITRMEMGSAFEEAVIYGLAARYAKSAPGRFVRPGELVLDDLIGTPDLLDMHEETVDEIKLTWMSSRHGDDPESEKFWKYWVQGKCYAHMMGWRRVRLRVGFVNGNYRDSRDPRVTIWHQEFTEDELLSNWRMVTSNGVNMRKEIAAGTYRG